MKKHQNIKHLLICLLILITGRLFSQITGSYPPEQWQVGKNTNLWIDSLKTEGQPKRTIVIPGIGSIERMPVVTTANKGVFRGNNRKGFDVYSMKLDNMPCLVPDSTFQAYLPGAGLFKKQNPVKRPIR